MDKKILDRYDSAEGAASYSKKFQRHWNEYINNWNEQKLVKSLLSFLEKTSRPARALDCPCGYGRLFPHIQKVADEVVEGDYSSHLLDLARENQSQEKGVGPAAAYVQADALDLPFEENSFDLVVSVRLCHHIRERDERLQYVREISRVSREWVLFTYFDRHSIKNRLREFRRKFNPQKRAKWTLSRSEVREVADEMGFDVVKSTPLSRLFSGHRYELLRRRRG